MRDLSMPKMCMNGPPGISSSRIMALSFICLLIFFFFAFSATAQSTGFTNQQQLYFTGSSSDPATLYQDAIDGNVDVGLQLCGVGQRYVGAFYALYDGSWNYVLVSYDPSGNALTDANQAGACDSTIAGFFTMSPSYFSTNDPDTYKAAFPGKLWVGYSSSSANPGTVSNFAYGSTNAYLLGDYSVTRAFSESTRQVTIQTPTISFQTSSGSFSYAANHASYGIDTQRRMVIGFCSDDYGASCSDGSVFSSAAFPATFDSGLSAGQVNDQNTYTRYVVLNSIGKTMCIGSNLQISTPTASPDPVYYSQVLNSTFTISNPRDTPDETSGGNVAVTTDFLLNISIYNASDATQVVYFSQRQITDDLSPDENAAIWFNWTAFARSGTYTIKVVVDAGGEIEECVEGDNSQTKNFVLKPITIPEIYIDGQRTDNFSYANVPYNLTIHLRNSDNTTLNNATVQIVEQNGLTLMVPTQVYNHTVDSNGTEEQTGPVTTTSVEFSTDYYGNASFTFIPTYNRLYLAQYNYSNLEDYIGNYSLYFQGSQADGEDFKFVIGGVLYSTYPLNILNTSYPPTIYGKGLDNERMVGQVLDFVYHVFANFLNTIIP
ncbi:MAG: CARDB domain-containing protein [archaeon]